MILLSDTIVNNDIEHKTIAIRIIAYNICLFIRISQLYSNKLNLHTKRRLHNHGGLDILINNPTLLYGILKGTYHTFKSIAHRFKVFLKYLN